MENAKAKVLRFSAQDVIATSGPYTLTISGNMDGIVGNFKVSFQGVDYGNGKLNDLQGALSGALDGGNPYLKGGNANGVLDALFTSASYKDTQQADGGGDGSNVTMDGIYTWDANATYPWGKTELTGCFVFTPKSTE